MNATSIGVVAVVLATVGCRAANEGPRKAQADLCEIELKDHLREVKATLLGLAEQGMPPNMPEWILPLIDFRERDELLCSFPGFKASAATYIRLLFETRQLTRAADYVQVLIDKRVWGWPEPLVDRHDEAWGRETSGNRRHGYYVRAWNHHQPTFRPDARAEAFTLLDGAIVAWQFALLERMDLFEAKDEAAAVARISTGLTSIGLTPPPRLPTTPLTNWVWEAPVDALDALAEELAKLGPKDRDDPRLVALRRGRYDLNAFRAAIGSKIPDSNGQY